MFTAGVELNFSAAHRHSGADEDCARVHGHNYRVEVVAEAARLRQGMVLDFRRLRRLAAETIQAWDHRLLNELPEFGRREPTTEEICRLLYRRLALRLKGAAVRLREVKVWETEKNWASFRR